MGIGGSMGMGVTDSWKTVAWTHGDPNQAPNLTSSSRIGEGHSCYPHFTEEEPGAQRGQATCPMSAWIKNLGCMKV